MSFAIIGHKGTPNEALTEKGIKVTRQETLYVEEWQAFVKCADYDNHFLYRNPDEITPGPAYLCTCGGPAMVRGNSPKGLFVCMMVEQFGEHSTTFYNVKDIDKMQGKFLSIGDNKRVKIRDRKK